VATPWIELGAVVWLREQVLTVERRSDRVDLPSLEGLVLAGVDFGSAR
jgi:hypothetical protein